VLQKDRAGCIVLTWITDVREVDRDTLEPILFLLQNPDIEVQRAASAALGNLAVNSRSMTSIHYLNRTDCLKPKTKSPL
jgi:vacuolar protein 8